MPVISFSVMVMSFREYKVIPGNANKNKLEESFLVKRTFTVNMMGLQWKKLQELAQKALMLPVQYLVR